MGEVFRKFIVRIKFNKIDGWKDGEWNNKQMFNKNIFSVELVEEI